MQVSPYRTTVNALTCVGDFRMHSSDLKQMQPIDCPTGKILVSDKAHSFSLNFGVLGGKLGPREQPQASIAMPSVTPTTFAVC